MSAADLPKLKSGSRAAIMRRRQAFLGLMATLVVAILWSVGLLSGLENQTLDRRARWFDSHSPPPSPALVLVAIDDASERSVGRWPWPRRTLAGILNEISRAGAKTIALDLLLSLRSQIDPLNPVTEDPTLAFDDAQLARAIADHGQVVIATSFPLRQGARTGNLQTFTDIAIGDVLAQLRDRPELRTMPPGSAVRQLASTLLPPDKRAFARGPEIDTIREQYEAAIAVLELRERSSIPIVPGSPLQWLISQGPLPPILPLARRAASIANVTFDSFDADGNTRRVPLLLQYEQSLWPNLGLAAALHFLDAPPSALRVEADRVTITRPDGQVVSLALRSGAGAGDLADVNSLHLLTWPRGTLSSPLPTNEYRPWQWQFWDTSAGRDTAVSIAGFDEPRSLTERILDNLSTLDVGVKGVLLRADLRQLTPEQEQAYTAAITPMRTADPESAQFQTSLAALTNVINAGLEEARSTLEFQAPEGTDLSTLTAEERDKIENLKGAILGLPAILKQIRDGAESISRVRANLAERVKGKLVMVGFTSTGSNADVIATSIDPRTPGPLVHMAIANEVLTGFTRMPGPLWGDVLAIFALGLTGTLLGINASVIIAPLGTLALIGAWFAIAGLLFWDRWWTVVSVAGPATAAAAGVGIVILHRLLVEQRSRRTTEDRFKRYLAPTVVDILVNNPEMDSMKPQRKTLSIMFTDLAGFTTTAERLGGDVTAKVLGTHLGRMTEIVQSTGATLDKYIGDAIVAFWGAPLDNTNHAIDACRAAVLMIRAQDELNASGAFGDAGYLTMRVGVCTGEVMVGDFGNPPRNSSYTVIGDTANTASRLEGANKFFGSRIMIGGSTRDLIGDRFLVRPLGDVKVKGKREPLRLYELVGDLNPKGERTAEWIALSEAMIRQYAHAQFVECLASLDRLEREFGDATLANLYRDQITDWKDVPIINGRPEGFDGSIELKEK